MNIWDFINNYFDNITKLILAILAIGTVIFTIKSFSSKQVIKSRDGNVNVQTNTIKSTDHER